MLLHELTEGLPIEIVRGDPARVRVCDLTEDSRTALPGSLFIARCGLTSDGRVYAHDAIHKGTVAILTDTGADLDAFPPAVPLAVCRDVPLMTALLAERLHGHPSKRLLLVGVTGTNGKTTVTHLVHQLLNRCSMRCGMIGTVAVDDGTEIAPAVMTTPPAIELSRTLATMVESGCDAAVMEVSSHGLDQKRADGLSFDSAVFTNVSGDHQDYHDSFEAYVAAKRRLLTLLDSAPGGPGGPAVLNADDPIVRTCEAARPVRCGMHGGSDLDWTVQRQGSTLDGERLSIRNGEIEITARVALFGAHNASNVLQAVATVWDLLGRDGAGVKPARRCRMIADALTLVRPPRGRLEPVHRGDDDIAVFVDFAHTDDALGCSLAALREAKPEGATLWVVFGCGGERDRTKRARMGLAAIEGADRIIVTSDNPRTESPGAIVADVLEGISQEQRGRVNVHIDRDLAIRSAIEQASRGDVIVIAGKGHETEQSMPDGGGGKVARRFVDQDVAHQMLAERRGRVGNTNSAGLAV